jgi:hypothetical protein
MSHPGVLVVPARRLATKPPMVVPQAGQCCFGPPGRLSHLCQVQPLGRPLAVTFVPRSRVHRGRCFRPGTVLLQPCGSTWRHLAHTRARPAPGTQWLASPATTMAA